MTTEADRLAAEGTLIYGADGGEVPVRFTLRALKRCEDLYGTLDGTVTELQWLVRQDDNGYPDPVTDRLAAMLSAVTGSDADIASNPQACIEALAGAWVEAFPEPEGKAEAPPAPSRGTPGGASPTPKAT